MAELPFGITGLLTHMYTEHYEESVKTHHIMFLLPPLPLSLSQLKVPSCHIKPPSLPVSLLYLTFGTNYGSWLLPCSHYGLYPAVTGCSVSLAVATGC